MADVETDSGDGSERRSALVERRRWNLRSARNNSYRAVQDAYDMGRDTLLRTFLADAPDVNFARMQGWIARLCAHERQTMCGNDARYGSCLTCGATDAQKQLGNWTGMSVLDASSLRVCTHAPACGQTASILHRALTLACTITDPADAEQIATPHIAEALQYRPWVDVE